WRVLLSSCNNLDLGFGSYGYVKVKVIFQARTPAFDLRFGKNKRMPVGNANQGHARTPASDLRFGKNKRMPVGNANQGHGQKTSKSLNICLILSCNNLDLGFGSYGYVKVKVIFQARTPAFDLRFGKNKRMPVGNANQGHGKVVSRTVYCALQKSKDIKNLEHLLVLRSKDIKVLEHLFNF
ncbi:hypothetical protein TSAR_015083, partial [Trichomalopsis sarcophagae]